MKSESLLQSASKMCLRYLGYHIMALFASLGLLSFISGVGGLFAAQLCDIVLIFVLPYLSMYKEGDTDCNRINCGHMKLDYARGLKAAYIAYLPMILASICCVLAKTGVIAEKYIAFYRLINAPFMPLIQVLLPTSLTVNEFSLVRVMICSATSLIVPLAPALGYYQGVQRISFVEEFKLRKKESINR